MERLLAYLNSIHPLSKNLYAHFATTLQIKHVSKGQFLLKAGHICRNMYFIEKGLVRCFYLKGLAEVSAWFMKEGDVFISIESFFKQQPSYENIVALEECTLYYLNFNQLQHIYINFPEANFIGRVLTQEYYILSEQRSYSLRMQRATDRYKYLRENFPELIQRVPSKHLATYLGITEVTLSRLKGRK